MCLTAKKFGLQEENINISKLQRSTTNWEKGMGNHRKRQETDGQKEGVRMQFFMKNGGYSRVKLLHDPKKIARKRFMAFLCSLRSIVKHTTSRLHSDHQKVFKSNF